MVVVSLSIHSFLIIGTTGQLRTIGQIWDNCGSGLREKL